MNQAWTQQSLVHLIFKELELNSSSAQLLSELSLNKLKFNLALLCLHSMSYQISESQVKPQSWHSMIWMLNTRLGKASSEESFQQTLSYAKIEQWLITDLKRKINSIKLVWDNHKSQKLVTVPRNVIE